MNGEHIDAETVRDHLSSARRSLGLRAKGEVLPYIKMPVGLARWLVRIAEAAERFEREAGPFEDAVTEALHTFPAPDGGQIEEDDHV